MGRAIVTGSSRGIGFELVKLLADEGYEVLALSRDITSMEQLDRPGITALPFDITSPGDLETLSHFLEREWDSVDVLINNAGKLLRKPFSETSAEDLRGVYEVNVFGLAELTRLVLPKMSADGHVLSISSMGGIQGSAKFPGLSAYSSSKAAVIALTEIWAEEYRETGPRFNVLALGAVQTEMLQEAFPGYKATISAIQMAEYIKDFALNGHRFYNGKVLQVSLSTP